MEDQLYQNIDTPQTNPLEPQSPVTNSSESPSSKKLLDFHDTKIIILTILGSILIILVIAAIVMSLIRSSKPQSVTLPNNDITSTPVTPTIRQDVIPSPYVEKFETIQKSINPEEDFLPPSIDTTIGL